jgi:hypothetical protein
MATRYRTIDGDGDEFLRVTVRIVDRPVIVQADVEELLFAADTANPLPALHQ